MGRHTRYPRRGAMFRSNAGTELCSWLTASADARSKVGNKDVGRPLAKAILEQASLRLLTLNNDFKAHFPVVLNHIHYHRHSFEIPRLRSNHALYLRNPTLPFHRTSNETVQHIQPERTR